MIVGHAIAIAAAVAALTLCGLVGAPSALLVGMTLPRVCAVGLALGLTMVAMLAAGTVHVPAGTTALLVALGVIRTGAETVILALAVLGIALVIAVFRTLTDRVTEALGGPTRRPAPRRRRTRQAT
jgi:CBS-domain-containing membrane protein